MCGFTKKTDSHVRRQVTRPTYLERSFTLNSVDEPPDQGRYSFG